MTAIRNEAIGYINEMPEERLESVLHFLRNFCEKKHPPEIPTKEEMYRKINEGLDDVKNGRLRPLDEVMDELREDLRKRIAEQ